MAPGQWNARLRTAVGVGLVRTGPPPRTARSPVFMATELFIPPNSFFSNITPSFNGSFVQISDSSILEANPSTLNWIVSLPLHWTALLRAALIIEYLRTTPHAAGLDNNENNFEVCEAVLSLKCNKNKSGSRVSAGCSQVKLKLITGEARQHQSLSAATSIISEQLHQMFH